MRRGPDRSLPARIVAAAAAAQIALTLAGSGCAATNPVQPTTREPAEVTAEAPAPANPTQAEAGVAALALGPNADFADLVTAAQASTGSPPADDCLLGRTDKGFALGVAAAPAASTWPQPSKTPAATTVAADGVTTPGRVLTPWGLVGPGGDGPLWMAFTPLPASAAQATGLLVELDRGQVRLHRTDDAAVPPAPMDHDALALEVVKQRGGEPITVYVAATAQTPLRSLHALLHRLPVDIPVALAVALPPGSSMPPATKERAVPARCPEGLPEPDDDAEDGELPRAQLVAAMAPLAESARGCFESARGRAASGGRVVVALRIGDRGSIAHACIASPTLGDPVLDTCIAENARQLRFAVPSPPGIVDVHLPLQLTAIESSPPRAVCPE